MRRCQDRDRIAVEMLILKIVLCCYRLLIVSSAAASSSPCGVNQFIDSNQKYSWLECTSPPSPSEWVIKSNGSMEPLSNVSVNIKGGTTLPFLDLESVSSIQNVTIIVDDVVVSRADVPIQRFLHLAWEQRDLTIVFRNCSFAFMTMEQQAQTTAAQKTTTTTPMNSFISSSYSAIPSTTGVTMQNVRVSFTSCYIQATLPVSLLFLQANSATWTSNLTILFEDSTVSVATSGVNVYVIVLFGWHVLCVGGAAAPTTRPLISTIKDIRLSFLRCNVSFTQNCTDPSSLCGNSTQTDVLTSNSAWVYVNVLNYLALDWTFSVEHSTFNAQLILPTTQTDATRLSHSMSLLRVDATTTCPVQLRGLSVHVVNVASFIGSSQSVALLRFDNVNSTANAVVTVQDSQVTLVAAGELNHNSNLRFAVLIFFGNWSLGPNLTLQVLRVKTVVKLLSGEETPSALIASPLVATVGALVYSVAGTIPTTYPGQPPLMMINIRDSTTRIDISNGTLPNYRPPFDTQTTPRQIISMWPKLGMYAMVASLVYLLRENPFSFLSVTVFNSSLSSSMGLIMGSDSTTFTSAVVTPITALITVASNCTSCNVTIVESVLEMVSLAFPKRDPEFNTFPSMYGTVSGRLLLNATALFQGFDVTGYGHLAILEALSSSPLANAFLRFSVLASFLSTSVAPIVYDTVQISITDCVVVWPVTQVPLPADVLALVSLPNVLKKSVLTLQATSSSSSPQAKRVVGGGGGDSTYPVTAISLLGSTIDEYCVLSVRGLGASAMISVTLGTSRIGQSTLLRFTDNTFASVPRSSSSTSSSTSKVVTAGITVFGANASLIIMMNLSEPLTATIFDVSNNNFTGGFHRLFDDRISVAVPPPPPHTASMRPAAVVHLGCNIWNGLPLPTTAIGPLCSSETMSFVQMQRVVDYPHSFFNGSEARQQQGGGVYYCRGLTTHTITMSLLPPTRDELQLLRLEAPSSAFTASWMNGAASLGALVSFSPSALFDAQTLAAVGGSTCAPPALKKSTSISQFMLSPFYPLGPAAMVLGNGALAVMCVLLHALAALVLLPRWSSRRQRSGQERDTVDTWAEKFLSRPSGGRSVEPGSIPWTVRLQFPSRSLALCAMLTLGVVYGATYELCTPSPLHTLCGILGVAMLIAAWFARRRALLSHRAQLLQWRLYPRCDVASHRAVCWVLPLGRWEPTAVRKTHGQVYGPVRGTKESYALYSLMCSLVVSVVAGVPVPPSYCVYQWSLLSCVPMVGCVISVVVHPSRARLSDALDALSYLVQLALFVTMSLLASRSGHGESESSAIGVLNILSSLVCFIRLIHGQYVSRWEGAVVASAAAPPARRSSFIVVGGDANEELRRLIVIICQSQMQPKSGVGK